MTENTKTLWCPGCRKIVTVGQHCGSQRCPDWEEIDDISKLTEEVEYWKKQSNYNYSVWMGLMSGPEGILALKNRIEELEDTLRRIIDQAKQEVPDEDILEIYRIARNKLDETEV
jgi:hypothetical protein